MLLYVFLQVHRSSLKGKRAQTCNKTPANKLGAEGTLPGCLSPRSGGEVGSSPELQPALPSAGDLPKMKKEKLKEVAKNLGMKPAREIKKAALLKALVERLKE